MNTPTNERLEPYELTSQNNLSPFETLASQPNAELIDLTGNKSAVINSEPLIKDPDGEAELLAVLEIPMEDGVNGHLAVGYHPNQGFFIGGRFSKATELDKSMEDRIDFKVLPLSFGTAEGTKLTLGRTTCVDSEPGNEDFKLPPLLTRNIMTEFGSQTSGSHFTIEVKDGKLRVTDHSTNGTKLIKHK